MQMLRLNVGAGRTRIPGFVNVDLSSRADVSVDLDREPLPFPDDSAELVFSYHTLEHLERYLFALGEIHRVLCHGGRLLIGVPYVTLSEYNLVNPYHRQHFNEHSFRFFETGIGKGSAAEDNPIRLVEVFHRYHYMGRFGRLPAGLRRWCRRHLFNVVRKIDFGLLAVKDPARPLPLSAGLVPEMLEQFDRCQASRVAYGPTAARADGLRQAG